MRKSRMLALGAALAFLAGAGWWFGSPWWTLWRMREAAQAGDSEALAAYIDFPALRASTRGRLGPFGGALAGRAVDALVSPAALRLALQSRNGSGGRGDDGELDLDRTGASEFRLRRGRTDLVFRRHGLGWKLEEIALSSAPEREAR
jgi:hypothetical protein